jgi:two-component system NtrC family sensor kinase
MYALNRELQTQQAVELATLSETWLMDRLLRLVYNQYVAVNVVALFSEQGELLAGPEYLESPDILGLQAPHEAVDEARAQRFLQAVPWAAAASRGVALGAPYRPEGARAAVVPLAVAAPGGVLAVELSLLWLQERFQSYRGEGQAVALLDSGGDPIVGVAGELLDQEAISRFRGNLSGEISSTLEDGVEVLATFDPVADTGWKVVVASLRSRTEGAGQEIQAKMIYFYGLAAALTGVVGFLGALQISRPVVTLKDAALAVADGELGRRVELGSIAELAELESAFNFMSRRLRLNREEIARKNTEIEAFNRDLQRMVEERTRELEQAQSRLVESSRLAAVAHMGAGLAHELNNPMAGILGMSQLALARNREASLTPMLRAIEAQAQRCREILAALGRLTDEGPGEREAVELHGLIDSVLELTGGRLQERGVVIAHERAGELKVMGDPVSLGQAFSQLLQSLSARLAPGGRLVIRGELGARVAELTFSLEGEERVARDDWLASGMGYWMAHQVVGQHEGWLEECKEEGPYCLCVFLPRSARAR